MTLKKVFLAACLCAAFGTAAAASYTSPGGAIPDNQPGNPLIVSFNVTESGPLLALDLTLTGLTHSWAGDLIVTLTAPNATVADIMRRPTTSGAASDTVGDSSNFGGTYRFIDGGGSLSAGLLGGTSAFVLPSGDYQASTRVVPSTATSSVLLNSVFAGTPVLGTWTLAITDNAGLDTGSLTSATLNVTAVPEPGTYVLFGLGLAGLAALRRRQAA